MSRRNDRKHVFGLVFQLAFSPETNLETDIDEYIDLYFEDFMDLIPGDFGFDADDISYLTDDIENSEMPFIKGELQGIYENMEMIDSMIAKYSGGWNIAKHSKVDLSILRLAVYEMLFNPKIPVGAAINEAVELAKIFSSDESPAFINGILGRIARRDMKEEINYESKNLEDKPN